MHSDPSTENFADNRLLTTASNGALVRAQSKSVCRQTASCGAHYDKFGVDFSKP